MCGGAKCGPVRRRGRAAALAAGLAAGLAAAPAAVVAQGHELRFSPNLYGMPGLVDMPTAGSFRDADLITSFGWLPGTSRVTLAFQITDRLTGSFRYSRVERPGTTSPVLYDRSFDLHYRLLDEGSWWPSLAVGLRDFIGTGVYSSEYLVATRTLAPGLRVTGGLGWGRLASHGGFRNPLGIIDPGFETRPGRSDEGGLPLLEQFFRGDAAFFGGVEWQVNDRLRLVAEYSSDAYTTETAPGAQWDWARPFNFGASYRVSDSTTLSAYAMHGAVVALQASVVLNPRLPSHGGVRVTAPQPVVRRVAEGTGGDWSTAWAARPGAAETLTDALRPLLTAEGMVLHGVQIGPTQAVVRYSNTRHEAPARAVGRVARAMTAVFPPSVEEFVLVPMVNGVAGSAVTIRRTDIESYEFHPQGTEELLAQVHFADAVGLPGVGRLWEPMPEGQRRFAWSVSPYLALSFFDPDNPVRGDVGIRADGRFALASNLVLSGAITQRLAGNTRGSPRGPGTPGYEPVRTSGPLYSSDSPVVDTLMLEHFGRPFANTFTRVSVGHLERMYGGLSAEVLWMPEGSRLALGAEVNHVWRRDPDSLLGVLDYDVTTGHLSAYYDFGNGFLGQVDAGRYLAGDWGATVRLEREFANGWRIGAFATLTDMPFEVFGEGSFDKGITLTIPLTWVLGTPSQTMNTATLRSLTRDGGARLDIRNRLYPAVREVRSGRMTDTWGTVWQ